MCGWLLIRDNPYMAASDEHGKLTIANLPAGDWTFRVWHEWNFVKQAKRDGKAVEWPRGRLTLKIELGDNDLGEILLPAESLQGR